MRIGVDVAREYFSHPTQLKAGMLESPDDLPESGMEYWARGPICGAFHPSFWPGVWMVHYGVKPEAWGNLIAPAREELLAFWDHHQPERIIGWTKASNRLAVAFARRIGFKEDGRMSLPSGDIIMTGWVPECQ